MEAFRNRLIEDRVEDSNIIRIGKRIKELREARDLTQIEVAKRLGFNSSSPISRLEYGAGSISYESACRYADILGSTPEYILFGVKDDLYFMDADIREFVTNPKNYQTIKNLVIDLEIKRLEDLKK